MNRTKGKLAQDLFDWFVTENVSKSSIVSLFKILKENVPQIDLPTHISRKGNYISDLENYCIEYVPILKIDICENGCMAYTGDASRAMSCKFCDNHRFHPCKYPQCKNNGESLKEKNCRHTDRIPKKTMQYRSIKSIIAHLMNFPLFIDLIQYSYFNLNLFFDRNQKYYDLKECEIYKKHFNEMKQEFENLFPNSTHILDDGEVKSISMINILLGYFYDGCQVFKSKVMSFLPLLIHICNLPPIYRSKFGLGTFLLSIFTSDANSYTETFLFGELFAKELNALEQGFKIEICGKWYLVQVRLIQSIFDTKGLEDHYHMQAHNSKNGCCICNCGEGTSIQDLDRVVYIQLRQILHWKHFLRYVGQSRVCCPKGFYENNDPPQIFASAKDELQYPFCTKKEFEEAVKFQSRQLNYSAYASTIKGREINRQVWKKKERKIIKQIIKNEKDNNNSKKVPEKQQNVEEQKKVEEEIKIEKFMYFGCEMDCSLDELYEWYNDPKEKYVWHNDNRKYPYEKFAPFLYFLHCDLRKQKVYRRKDTKWYMTNAAIFEKSEGKLKSSDGVKGVAPECLELNFEIADGLNWDPMHVLKNICEDLFDIWTGKVLSQEKVVRFCKLTHSHPSLFPKEIAEEKIKNPSSNKQSKKSIKNDIKKKKNDNDADLLLWQISVKARRKVILVCFVVTPCIF